MNKHGNRKGLTLVELIVVLVILVGLAGIIIPMLPNLIGRTHTATGATNISEAVKWIQTYEAMNLKFPNNWDLLTDGSASTLPDYLPGTVDLQAGALGGTGLSTLKALGITELFPMVKSLTGNQSATFNPYSSPNPLPLTDETPVALLKEDAIKRLNLSITGTYVVFGFGGKSDIIGATISEAPIHFSDNATTGPADKYCRYGVVFKIADLLDPKMSRARMSAVVAFHEGGLTTAGNHIQEYYGVVNATK